MSTLIGQPYELNLPTAILGVSTGRVLSFNNPGWVLFTAAWLTIQTTVTVGSRLFSFRFQDPSGNILFQGYSTVSQTASQTQPYVMGQLPNLGNPARSIFCPDELPLPPFSTLTILDTANFDVNDSVITPNFILSN
jgi:hypothetical protein